MDINNPFKTKEESLKTILSGNIRGMWLTSYLVMLNDNLSGQALYLCFYDLYIKYPEEFFVETSETTHTLYFLNHKVLTLFQRDSVKDTETFFNHWDVLSGEFNGSGQETTQNTNHLKRGS